MGKGLVQCYAWLVHSCRSEVIIAFHISRHLATTCQKYQWCIHTLWALPRVSGGNGLIETIHELSIHTSVYPTIGVEGVSFSTVRIECQIGFCNCLCNMQQVAAVAERLSGRQASPRETLFLPVKVVWLCKTAEAVVTHNHRCVTSIGHFACILHTGVV